MEADKKQYSNWLDLRESTKNEDGALCYCGHTNRCDCGDPDETTFKESVARGDINMGDPNNGWKTVENEGNFTRG
jgi:hypothetical protein